MLEWLDNGYRLNQIGGNTGIYVATRAGKSAVVVTKWDDSLERQSEWFRNEVAATKEAQAILSDRLARV